MRGAGRPEPVRRRQLGDYEVEQAATCPPVDLAAEVPRLVDPGASRRTLHWGRNYLYVSEMVTPAGAVEVVVKQFRNQGMRDRLRRRLEGSKAEKSWRVAHALAAAGFATPEPLLLIESRRSAGPSYFVSRYLPHDFEARYYFRALNAGREGEAFPGVGAAEFLDALGRAVRRLHDGGFLHRDLSAGNLLIRCAEGGEPYRFYLVDLNRVGLAARITLVGRCRGLCRLPVLRPEHRELLLAAYWGRNTRALALKRFLYLACHRGFLLKNRVKEAVRGPLKALHDLLVARRPHAHIPPAPAGVSARDKVAWDHLSDQPHQHATRLERLRVRLADSATHATAAAAVAAAAPRIWRRYRSLRALPPQLPRPWGGVGVALRPFEPDPQKLLTAVAAVGVRHVLLRLHPWQADHRAEEELARELAGRGVELLFALPQNRALVRDLGAWTAAVEELAERFLPFGRSFQIGQAINRSKWGIWNYREYLRLAAAAAAVLRRRGEVLLAGPAVIDFELQGAAAVLNMRRAGVRFDAVASLLYVDRRGAPENRQLGFDTPRKVTLLKAIADTARNAAGRCWITEFNWPLREGPHSPAGRDVAVDEERQADYLVRYYLLALGSGMIERAYWWQVIARGYGLVDPRDDGTLRRRPSFHALATLERQLAGSTFLGPIAAPAPARLLRFAGRDGEPLLVGWSSGAPVRVELPAAVVGAVGRDGEELPAGGRAVELGPAPRYYRLEAG